MDARFEQVTVLVSYITSLHAIVQILKDKRYRAIKGVTSFYINPDSISFFLTSRLILILFSGLGLVSIIFSSPLLLIPQNIMPGFIYT